MAATTTTPALALAGAFLGLAALAGCSRDHARERAGATELHAASMTLPFSGVSLDDDAAPAVASGARVRMYDGTTKPIEEVALGDRVLSYSPSRGMVAGTVTSAEKRGDAIALVRVNGALALAPSQRVYAAGEWTPASELASGRRLVAVDRSGGEPATVATVERLPARRAGYALRVEPEHDFFADGVLVRDDAPTP
jgi:hypothetical protein